VTLGEKQRVFTRNVAHLIAWAYDNGYELTFSDAYRSPQQAAANAAQGVGIAQSLHMLRLAVDLNLFKDGVWIKESEAHRPLGEFWKGLNPENCWGGDFSKPDGNHYSMTHAGVK